MITHKQINDKYFDKEINVIEGFDEAILGVDNDTNKVCYSFTKLIDVCMESGKSFDDAVNYVRYDIIKEKSNQFIFIDDIF